MLKAVWILLVLSFPSCTATPGPGLANTGSRVRLLYVHHEKGRTETPWTLHSIDPITLADSGPICEVGNVCTTIEASPDGRLAAWIAPPHVFLVDLETGRKEAIETFRVDPERDLWVAPKWSPDGNRLIFECRSSEGFGPYKIWDRETRTISDLKDFPRGIHFDPVWSPDGRRVAFDGPKLLIWSADSGKLREFALGSRHTWKPHWSSDGTTIRSIGSEAATDRCRVVSLDLETGRQVWMNPLQANIREFAWSLDGDTVAYVLGEREGRRTLVGSLSKQSIFEVGQEWHQIRWSPEDRFIAFTAYWRGVRHQDRSHPDASDIAIYDVDSRETRILTRSGANLFPSWIEVRR